MVSVGLFLLFLGILMLVIHLTVSKGLLVDPISVSWLGYLLCIPGTIFFAAPDATNDYGLQNYLMSMYVTGSIAYIIGLYSGKATFLTKILPVPSERLNLTQLWLIISISGILFMIFWSGVKFVPSGLVNVIRGLNSASVGAMVLLGSYTIICYRGHFITKLLTGLLSIAVLILMLKFYWSRRPVFAVLFSAMCLFYYKKLLWQPIMVRSLFWAVVGVFSVCLLLYLGASRHERVYLGKGGVTAAHIWSKETLHSFGRGLSIGHFVFERVVYTYQTESEFGFQYGKTYIPGLIFWIPRSIWPSKPETGGGIATIIYHGLHSPVSVSPTPIGEAYINFGFLGVIFIPFLAGRFVRGFNTHLINNQSNEVLWLVWFAVAPDFASQWRGDFTSMFVQAFLRISFILILAWVTKRIGRQAYEDSHLLEQDELYTDDSAYYSY